MCLQLIVIYIYTSKTGTFARVILEICRVFFMHLLRLEEIIVLRLIKKLLTKPQFD